MDKSQKGKKGRKSDTNWTYLYSILCNNVRQSNVGQPIEYDLKEQ